MSIKTYDSYRDDVNNKRVEETKQRVGHAIRLVSDDVEILKEQRKSPDLVTNMSHAINLLERGLQDMRWACEHFKWNDDVCDLISEATMYFGMVIAELMVAEEVSEDSVAASRAGTGLTLLSQALATLLRWYDDEADVAEV